MPNSNDPITRVRVGDEELMLVPSTVNDARVDRLGLSIVGTENVSHLLVPPPNLLQQPFNEEHDYRPEDAVEWVIDVEFEGDPIHQATTLENVFNQEWLNANGRPTIFGWSPEINHWTYLVAADAPKTFTKLAFGWQLFRSYEESYRISADEMKRFLRATEQQARNLGKPTLRSNRSADEAARLSDSIRKAVAQCDQDVVIMLRAPNGKTFAGKDVWDVMMCLGLRWGDGDLFHWHNDSSFGHDIFFSVETTTPPGYFLPEEIAAGRTRVEDLFFSFSIPRSADPVSILDSLLKTTAYAKSRLGGELRGEDGKPLSEDQLRRKVHDVVDQLKAAGFNPGETATLHVF